MTTGTCPKCEQPARSDAANVWRPFCSERCKMVDLGRWLAEDYRIEAEGDSEPESDAEPEPSLH